MKQTPIRFTVLQALVLSVVLSSAAAAQEGQSAAERFPPGSIASLETAEQALSMVEAERARAYARFAEEENTCRSRFFMNRCIEQAKERRRQALQPLETLELEAKRFQRQQRALERDRELAERRARAAEKEARAAAAEPRTKPEPRPVPPPAPVVEPPAPKRVRPTLTPEQEREAARERAENEAAYARKVQAAKEHQEAVARRKAEKERRRAEREAAAAKAVEAEAPTSAAPSESR